MFERGFGWCCLGLLLLRGFWGGCKVVNTEVEWCGWGLRSYYFSTHGCMRLGSCFVVGAFDELAFAAAAWRAFTLKKSAIVMWLCCCVEVGMLNSCTTKVRRVDARPRTHVFAQTMPVFTNHVIIAAYEEAHFSCIVLNTKKMP